MERSSESFADLRRAMAGPDVLSGEMRDDAGVIARCFRLALEERATEMPRVLICPRAGLFTPLLFRRAVLPNKEG